jgi:hypothetical protein
MWNDPIVEEIRLNSAQIAAQFNYDVHALGRYYQERQKLENRTVVSRKPRLIKELQPILPQKEVH